MISYIITFILGGLIGAFVMELCIGARSKDERPNIKPLYYDILEKYCVELEKINNRLTKALNKACERLEFMAKEINELHGYFDNKFVKKNKWKEWALKDE